MPQRTHPDGPDQATESKFYLPAGVTPSFDASQVKRIWATLFEHQVDPPK